MAHSSEPPLFVVLPLVVVLLSCTATNVVSGSSGPTCDSTGRDDAPCAIRRAYYDCGSVPSGPNAKGCQICNPKPTCTSGTYCPFINISATIPFPCPGGGFCPELTACVKACPPGYYCTNGTPIPCPAHYFCPLGADHPHPCHFLDRCHETTGNATTGARWTVFVAMFLVALLCAIGLYLWDQVRRAHSLSCREPGIVTLIFKSPWPEAYMDYTAEHLDGVESTSPPGVRMAAATHDPQRFPPAEYRQTTVRGDFVEFALTSGGATDCPVMVRLGSTISDYEELPSWEWNYKSITSEGERVRHTVSEPGIYLLVEHTLTRIAASAEPEKPRDANWGLLAYPMMSRAQQPGTGTAQLGDETVPLVRSDPQKVWPDDPPLGYACKDLSFRNGNDGKILLNGTCCIIRPNKLTAIMGPSGCGKTTLLNVLCGKSWTYGRIQNPPCLVTQFRQGAERDESEELMPSGVQQITAELLEELIPYVGFVPQEDTMTRTATVEEVVTFQARGRVPVQKSDDYVKDLVSNVLNILKIDHLRGNRIGDENVKGISGGQRKRVNVAMELVATPSVLFLDEPTSGLDATTSRDLVKILKALAKRTTVITVIHQPRREIFDMLDDLIILAGAGRTAYCGPASVAVTYFSLSRSHPNPADGILDFVCDQKNRDELQRMVEENRQKTKSLSGMKEVAHVSLRQPASKMLQLWMYLKRCMTLSYLRKSYSVLFDHFMVFLGAMFLSSALPYKSFGHKKNQFSLGNLLLCMFCQFAGLPSFSPEISIMTRESAAGFSILAYFAGKEISLWPKVLMMPFVFSAIQYNVIVPGQPFIEFFLTMIGLSYASIGCGMLLSAAIPGTSTQMAAVLLSFIFLIVSGVNPKLVTIWDSVPFGLGGMLTSVSPIRWSYELLLTSEYAVGSEYWKVCTMGDMWTSGPDPDKGTFVSGSGAVYKLANLFVLGVTVRILACLYLLHADWRRRGRPGLAKVLCCWQRRKPDADTKIAD